ncbi:DUF4913 domain-containing protein [Nocardiopsis kunsanensis]|uniref:DUF4913 domain-containing protein n=1 Tax=Nocardiopsis kunsanensis TaxID=141693 RepID=A0A919CKL8_9ACTN|nr:DUF4913 domain-containing protein [Nocardiopsis kunsanensis]GHD31230.1 hypothetical protein GCM10007147_33900 [Nocardiopsis kunsanensis]
MSTTQEEAQQPPFIFALTPDEYTVELAQLTTWVNGFLVPVYVTSRIPSSRAPWCARWWKHPEAIGRLHALWLAYQAMSDTGGAGITAPHEWHRDHLDPALASLRAPDGPFSGCMTKPHQDTHNPPPEVTVVDHTGL